MNLGNNIPQDILKAISVAIKLNNDREVARHQEVARTEKMMKEMQRIELEKTMQVAHFVSITRVNLMNLIYTNTCTCLLIHNSCLQFHLTGNFIN